MTRPTLLLFPVWPVSHGTTRAIAAFHGVSGLPCIHLRAVPDGLIGTDVGFHDLPIGPEAILTFDRLDTIIQFRELLSDLAALTSERDEKLEEQIKPTVLDLAAYMQDDSEVSDRTVDGFFADVARLIEKGGTAGLMRREGYDHFADWLRDRYTAPADAPVKIEDTVCPSMLDLSEYLASTPLSQIARGELTFKVTPLIGQGANIAAIRKAGMDGFANWLVNRYTNYPEKRIEYVVDWGDEKVDLKLAEALAAKHETDQRIADAGKRAMAEQEQATPELKNLVAASLAYESSRERALDQTLSEPEDIPAILLFITADALRERDAEVGISDTTANYVTEAEALIHAMRRRGIIVTR